MNDFILYYFVFAGSVAVWYFYNYTIKELYKLKGKALKTQIWAFAVLSYILAFVLAPVIFGEWAYKKIKHGGKTA